MVLRRCLFLSSAARAGWLASSDPRAPLTHLSSPSLHTLLPVHFRSSSLGTSPEHSGKSPRRQPPLPLPAFAPRARHPPRVRRAARIGKEHVTQNCKLVLWGRAGGGTYFRRIEQESSFPQRARPRPREAEAVLSSVSNLPRNGIARRDWRRGQTGRSGPADTTLLFYLCSRHEHVLRTSLTLMTLRPSARIATTRPVLAPPARNGGDALALFNTPRDGL
ncbi:hypothetical protein DFH11DRAFT_1594544 [Phellopilus nigrolimitatus]|nr:hypothetical protein DFH11DRAFT_1594544 [Phellopilus nigrolimitatus]